MKKILTIFTVICTFLMSASVYAGTAYVDSISIDAKIKEDGSMLVEETIVWDVVEEINGVYRDILIQNSSNELNSATKITIHQVTVNGNEFEREFTRLLNGASGKYNVNTLTGGKQVKIFAPSADEYITTRITYTLYDVIVKYNDVAELYWNFIGSGWEYGLDDVSINITLPGDSKLLKVFAHGPLYGYSAIPSSNSVAVKVESLRSNEIVDARVLFDSSLVSTSKVAEQNILESILAEEAKLAEQANFNREKAKKSLYYSIIIVLIALLIPVFVYIDAYKKAKKAKFNGKYYRELPEDYGPAIMNKLLYPTMGTTSSNDMLATLLDLVRRKYIEIKPIIPNGKKKPEDYLLKLVKTDLLELNESEKHFVETLIFVDTQEITIKELRKKNSKSIKAKNKAVDDYKKWTEIITELAKEKDLIKKEKIKIGKYLLRCIPSMLALITVAVYGFVNNYEDIISIGMFSAIFGVFELIWVCLGVHELNVRTEKGIEHKLMWKAFRKFLLDFSKLDEHDYKSIAIWEHYLVYAVALGISKKVIKELKIVFPTEFEDGSDMFATYTTIGLLSDNDVFTSFSNSFTSAASAAFNAPSSADGSGGGFSGGAGGGRRWRRRWQLLIFENKYITRKT